MLPFPLPFGTMIVGEFYPITFRHTINAITSGPLHFENTDSEFKYNLTSSASTSRIPNEYVT